MREGRREEGGEEKEEGGRVLINRTSLFPTDSYIKPPKASKLNAFTLLNTEAHSLKPPLKKLAINFAQEIPRQKKEHQETVLLTLQILIKNLQVCWEKNQWLSIQGGNSAFSKGTQYEQMGLGRNIMRECLILLVSEGYVQKAEYDVQARQTALYYPLNSLQAIYMDSLYLPYKGFQRSGIFVKNGQQKILANLPSNHMDLVSIKNLHEILKHQRLPNYSPLQRIFTCSSKDPYFLNGGRLYTNTQLIPVKDSPIRKFTTINRERCCEIDFSANHLRMSAAFFNQKLSDDPYQEILNIVKVSCRDDIKRVFASLISTKESDTNKARNGLGYPKEKRLNPISFATFEVAYKAINQLFPWFKAVRGIGSNLQSIEGQILLETMSLLLEEGIISIPLHDALRVPAQHMQKTERIMQETWSKHLGVDFETKVTCKID